MSGKEGVHCSRAKVRLREAARVNAPACECSPVGPLMGFLFEIGFQCLRGHVEIPSLAPSLLLGKFSFCENLFIIFLVPFSILST